MKTATNPSLTLESLRILGEKLILFVEQQSSDIVHKAYPSLSGYKIVSITYPDNNDIALYEKCISVIKKDSRIDQQTSLSLVHYLAGSLFFDTAIEDSQRDAVEFFLSKNDPELYAFYANSKLRRNLISGRVSILEFATEIFGERFEVTDSMNCLADEIWLNVSEPISSKNFTQYEREMSLDKKLYVVALATKLTREICSSLIKFT